MNENILWWIEFCDTATVSWITFAFIGLCAFLKNNENENEIGYRLREKYWRKGFGTEVTIGLLNYGFDHLKMEKITADVDTRNVNSIKILEKFMDAKKEFFNEEDDCTDRRYEVNKDSWLQLNPTK